MQFLLSDDMLANYRRFLRTVRLHSRPVVMLQKNGFLKSIRGSASQFLESLADTQVCVCACVRARACVCIPACIIFCTLCILSRFSASVLACAVW